MDALRYASSRDLDRHEGLETTHTEPRFRALLTEGDAGVLSIATRPTRSEDAWRSDDVRLLGGRRGNPARLTLARFRCSSGGAEQRGATLTQACLRLHRESPDQLSRRGKVPHQPDCLPSTDIRLRVVTI